MLNGSENSTLQAHEIPSKFFRSICGEMYVSRGLLASILGQITPMLKYFLLKIKSDPFTFIMVF